MAEAVGYAILPVTLSIKGAQQQLTKELVGPAQSAAKKASDSVRKQLSSGADQAAKAVEAARRREETATRKVVDAEKALKSARDTAEQKAKSVESAELKLQAARSTEKSKVSDAEKKLADLRTSGKATTEQLQSAERNLEAVRATQGAKVIDAENRVQAARSASTSSADKAAAAEDKLATAKSRAATASQSVIDATRKLDEAQSTAARSADSAQGAFSRLKAKLSEMKESMFGAKSGAESAGAAASDMGSKFQGAHGSSESLGGSLGGFAKKAGLAAAAFAGLSGIGSTIQAGFDKVNKIEDTTASLEVMMGSADKAKKVMDDLQKSNQNTPYAFDAWSEAGKNLIAFGVDADKTAGIVTALGEAAASTGKGDEALSSMGRAFGQAAASGKISMETINTLADGGVQGLAILANEAGVSTEEMQKMISSGAVPAGEAIDTLTKGIMEGTEGAAGSTNKMAGTMEAMSETTSGRLKNMKAAFNNLAGSVMGAVAPAIATVAEKITDAIYAVKGWVDGLIDGEGAMQGVKKAIDVMMPVLKPLAFIIGSVAAALTALKLASLAYQGAALLASKATTALGKAMTVLMNHPIIVAIAAIVGALVWFFTQTETGKKVWQSLMDKLKVVGAWLKDNFGPVFEWLGGVISAAWEGIKIAFSAAWDFIQPILSTIGDVLSALWDGLKVAWDSVGAPVFELIKTVIGAWWEQVKQNFDTMKTVFSVVWDVLQIAWYAVGAPVLEVVKAAFQIMWEVVKVIFEVLKLGFEAVWAVVSAVWESVGKPVVDAIASIFQWLWDTVLSPVFSWIKDKWDDMVRGFQILWDAYGQPAVDRIVEVFNWFKDRISDSFNKVKEFAQGLLDSIRDRFDNIRDTVTGVKDKILDAVKGAKDWLKDAGHNIIEGLKAGLENKIKDIGKWFLDKLPSFIRGPFEKALDIHSPSRVFAGYGVYIGEGLIEGLESMGGAVADASQSMADRVADVDMPTLQADVQVPDAVTPAVQSAAQPAAEALTEVDTLSPVLQQQDQQLGTFGDLVTTTMQDVVGPVWDQMGQGITDVKTNLVDPAFTGIQTGLQTIGTVVTSVTGDTVNPVWQAMGANIQNVKTTVVDPAFLGVQTGLQAVGQTFVDSVNGVIDPQWSGMASHILAVKDRSILPAFGGVQSGLDTLGGWFSRTVDNIGTAWDRMRGATGRPAKFVVQTVFNDGIKKAWDSISDMIGEKKMDPVPLGDLGAYASGGVMPGYTPGRDVHDFFSPTGGRLRLSGGEAVMRPEWTRAVGGPAAVERMNAAARRGTIRRDIAAENKAHARNVHAHADGGVIQELASGGIVDAMTRIVQQKYPMMQMTSGYRPGSSDLHGAGMAGDFSNGTGNTPAMLALANDIADTYPNSMELIHDNPAFARNIKNGQIVGKFGGFYNEAQAGPHYHHVHWAMNTPPTMPFGGGVFSGGSAGGAVMVSITDSVKSMWDDAMKAIPKWDGGPGSFGGVPPKWQEKAADRTWKKIKKEADKIQTASGLVSTAGIANGPNRAMGQQMAARVGWTGAEWDALDQLWQHESGWNNLAQNPTSTAYGIPQFLDSTWASVGVAKTSDAKQQIAAGIKYIQQRPDYGVPSRAWALWNSRSPHWYDQGGQLKPGTTLAQNDTGKTEAVLTHEQWTDVSGLVDGISKLVPEVKQFAPEIQKWVDDNPDLQTAVEVTNRTMADFGEKHPDVAAEATSSMTEDALDFFGMKGAWFTDASALGIEWEVPAKVDEQVQDATATAADASEDAADAASSAADAAQSASVAAGAAAEVTGEAAEAPATPDDSVPAPTATAAKEPQMEKKTLDNSTVVNFVVENVQAADPQAAARDVMREARRVLAAYA